MLVHRRSVGLKMGVVKYMHRRSVGLKMGVVKYSSHLQQKKKNFFFFPISHPAYLFSQLQDFFFSS